MDSAGSARALANRSTKYEMAALVSAVSYDLPVIAKFDSEFAVEKIALAFTKKGGFRRGKKDMGHATSTIAAAQAARCSCPTYSQ